MSKRLLANESSMDGVIEEHTPYVLIEGVLEKSKQRKETFLKFTRRRSKAKWSKRYFVLRCGEIPDAFYLDQYTSQHRNSKIRKTLQMDRVSQVDTNISSKDNTKSWIFAIHFCGNADIHNVNGNNESGNIEDGHHSNKNKSVLYLAASSEDEMNRWVAQLCYACNLEKQDDNEPYSMDTLNINEQFAGGGSIDSFVETPSSESSVVDRFIDEKEKSKSRGEYTLLKNCTSEVASASNRTSSDSRRGSSESTRDRNNNNSDGRAKNGGTKITSHPYIHLKNCTSTRQPRGYKSRNQAWNEGDNCNRINNESANASNLNSTNRSSPSSSLSVSPSILRSRKTSNASNSTSSYNSNSNSDLSNNFDVLTPPPRPPKSAHLSHARKASGNVHDERNEIYSNGLFQLDNPLPPPRLDEIGIENNSDEDRGWSGETIKPIEPSESNDIKPLESPLSQSAGPSWQAPLPFIAPPHNRTQHTANVIRTPPLPFNHNSNNIADHDNNFQLIPPKVDRSCKPQRKGVSVDETNANKKKVTRMNSFVKRCDKHSYAGPPPSPMHFNNVSSSPPPVNNKKLSVPTIPRTNPFHRIQTPLKQPMPDPRELSQSNNSVSASSSDQLEYFDPTDGSTHMRSTSTSGINYNYNSSTISSEASFHKPSTHSVDYIVIDQQSTKAVFEANLQQNQLRSSGRLTNQ